MKRVSPVSRPVRVRRGRNKSKTRKCLLGARKLGKESLEARQLLAADCVQLNFDTFSIRENSGAQTVDVLGNDTFENEYDGLRKITSVTFGDQGGRVKISEDGTQLRYVPPANFSGEESFTYYVDGEYSQHVLINIESPLRDDSYQLKAVSGDHILTVMENDPFWSDYSGNRDITLVSRPQFGEIRIGEDRRSLIYTMDPHVADSGGNRNFPEDSVVYLVDGKYTAEVKIDVTSPLKDDFDFILQNSKDNVIAVRTNDPFWSGYAGERRITHVLDAREGAEAEISNDGSFIYYTPAPGFVGTETLRYVVDSTYEASMSFSVLNPTVMDRAFVNTNSTEFAINLTGNDILERFHRPSGKSIHYVVDSITSVDGTSEHGGTISLLADGRTVSYTPPTDFEGIDSFGYIADGQFSGRASVSVASPVQADWVNVPQGTVRLPLDVLDNDFGGNGYTGPRQITSVSASEIGAAIEIMPDGTLSYTVPATSDASGDTFKYTVDNEYVGIVTVDITNPVQSDFFRFQRIVTNQPLDVLNNDRVNLVEYTGAGRITSVVQPEFGSVSISADGTGLIFTGATSTSLEYTVDDAYSTKVRVSFPSWLRRDKIVTNQNTSGSVNVLENDGHLEGLFETRRLTGVSESEAGGEVTFTEDGQVLYTPPTDFQGNDRFTYTVNGILHEHVNVHVVRRVRDDIYRVSPDSQSNALPVMVNDLLGADYTGEGVITEIRENGNDSSIRISDDGQSLVYSPNAGFEGTDSFTYVVDGKLLARVDVEVVNNRFDRLAQFDSLDELRRHLFQDAIDRHYNGYGASLDRSSFDYSAAVDSSFSETNVQVSGVDEADLVENDGTYLFSVSNGELIITKALPADELKVVSRTNIGGNIVGAYLNGDRITVISRTGSVGGYPRYDLPDGTLDFDSESVFPLTLGMSPSLSLLPTIRSVPFYSNSTTVTVIDVSERSAPEIVQSTKITGRYVESRRVDDHVLVVTNAGELVLPGPKFDCVESECVRETQEEYTTRVEKEFASILKGVLPGYISLNGDGEVVRQGLVVEPEDIFRPLGQLDRNLINVTSFDMTSDTPGLTSSQGVMTSSATNVHGTRNALYVLDDHYDTASSEDPRVTRIMKFDWLPSKGGLHFSATGQVSGHINDQFSVDDTDGYLRIVSTVDNHYDGNHSGRSETSMFVLRDDEGILEIIGGTQNVGLGERVKSVRFASDRALITTFRNVDPLFGIDLSDPVNPQVVGSLSLPGYSSYLQFIDANHILAIGQNSSIERFDAAAVSLFNVEDLANPILIDQMDFPRFSNSISASDHHAFGWFSEHSQLSVPSRRTVRYRADEDGDGYAEEKKSRVEDDLLVWRIDPELGDNAIELSGTVEHQSALLRSAFINDQLYAISSNQITAVPVADPDTVIDTVTWEAAPVSQSPLLWATEAEVEFTRRESLSQLAAVDLASRFGGTTDAEFMTVAIESDSDSIERLLMVIRHGDVNHLYESAADQVRYVRSGFEYGATTPDQNTAEPADANADGVVTPFDALLVINQLDIDVDEVVRQVVDESSGTYADVNGDGVVSPLDALLVVNELSASERQASTQVASTQVASTQVASTQVASSVESLGTPPVVESVRDHESTMPVATAPKSIDSAQDRKEELGVLIDRVFASSIIG